MVRTEICIQRPLLGLRMLHLASQRHALRLFLYASREQRILCKQGVLGLPSLTNQLFSVHGRVLS